MSAEQPCGSDGTMGQFITGQRTPAGHGVLTHYGELCAVHFLNYRIAKGEIEEFDGVDVELLTEFDLDVPPGAGAPSRPGVRCFRITACNSRGGHDVIHLHADESPASADFLRISHDELLKAVARVEALAGIVCDRTNTADEKLTAGFQILNACGSLRSAAGAPESWAPISNSARLFGTFARFGARVAK